MKRIRKKVKPKFSLGTTVTGTDALGNLVTGKVIGSMDHSVIVENNSVRHRCYDSALEAVSTTEEPAKEKLRKS